MLSSHTPEKVRFYEVLISAMLGFSRVFRLLYTSEKVNNSKHFQAFLGLSYQTIYNPAAGCALLGCEKCYHAAPFRVSEMSVLLFYGCRNCRLCAALLRCASRAHAFRGYKISKRLLWTPKSPNTLQGLRNLQYLLRTKKMKDTAVACPGVLPICSATRPIWRMGIINNQQFPVKSSISPGYQYFLVICFQGVQNVLILSRALQCH